MIFLIINKIINISVYNMIIIFFVGCFMMCVRISFVLMIKVDIIFLIIIRFGNFFVNKFDVIIGNISKLEINKILILCILIIINILVRVVNM